jgi:TRAP-type C4-dicarboxylate transport system permease small subunit
LVLLSALATAAMFALLAVLIGRAAFFEYRFSETTPGLGIPRWWYTVWLPALSLWVAVRALLFALRGSHEEDHTKKGAL